MWRPCAVPCRRRLFSLRSGFCLLRLLFVAALPLCCMALPLSAAAQVLETAAVRGRVVRADGSPLAAMRLVLRPLEGAGGSRQGNAVTVLTSRRGEFTVLGLLPGEYRVEVGWPAPWLTTAGDRLEVQGGETAEVELRLKPDGVGFAVRAVLATGLSAGSPAEAGGGRDDPASRGLPLPGRVSGQKGAPTRAGAGLRQLG